MTDSDATHPFEDRKILVCEDEVWIALDIVYAVEDAGGTVLGPFATVDAGLAAMNSDTPDAAILDLNLLDGTSLPILEALNALDIPAIVQTGNEMPAGVTQSALQVVRKPMNPERLVSILAQHLDRA